MRYVVFERNIFTPAAFRKNCKKHLVKTNLRYEYFYNQTFFFAKPWSTTRRPFLSIRLTLRELLLNGRIESVIEFEDTFYNILGKKKKKTRGRVDACCGSYEFTMDLKGPNRLKWQSDGNYYSRTDGDKVSGSVRGDSNIVVEFNHLFSFRSFRIVYYCWKFSFEKCRDTSYPDFKSIEWLINTTCWRSTKPPTITSKRIFVLFFTIFFQ